MKRDSERLKQKDERAKYYLCTRGTNSHLDGEHGDALWAVDAVPDAEVPPVLGHHHVTAGYPLDIRAEAQQCGLHAGLYVIEM